MAVRTISTKIALDGEQEFKKQMNSVNSELKTLKSEMTLANEAFKGQANTMDALTKKDEILRKEKEQQIEKIKALKEAVSDSTKAFGDADTRTDKYRQQLNNAEAGLIKLDRELQANQKYMNEAKNSADSCATSIDGYGKEIKTAAEQTSSFGEILKANLSSEAIISGIKAVAGAAKELGTAIKDTILDSAAYADDILTKSTVTGIGTDQLQAYTYMAGLTDTSVDTITGSLTKLTRNMATAQKGTGDAAKAFEALGVAITDESGELRDNQDVFFEALDVLGKMSNETQADAYAMQIFGKSAQDLKPLMAQGKEGLAELTDEAIRVGAVLPKETLESLGAVDDAMQRLTGTLDATKNAIGAEFAEPVESILTGFTAVLQGETEKGLGLIEDGFEQAGQILAGMGDEAEKAIDLLLGTIIDRLPDILDAGSELIVSLLNGIAEKAPDMVPKITELIQSLLTTIAENLPEIVEAGLNIVVALGGGIIEALPEIATASVQIIFSITKAIGESLHHVVNAGFEIVQGLWNGISGNIDWLRKKLKGWVDGIVSDIKGFFGINSPSRVMRDQIGKYLADGVGEGFVNEMSSISRDMAKAIPSNFEVAATMNTNLQRPSMAQSVESGMMKAISTSEMVRAISESVTGNTGAMGTIQLNSVIKLDSRVIGESVTEYQVARERARG